MPENIPLNVAREAIREAVREWHDDQFAKFGKWTFRSFAAAVFAALVGAFFHFTAR